MPYPDAIPRPAQPPQPLLTLQNIEISRRNTAVAKPQNKVKSSYAARLVFVNVSAPDSATELPKWSTLSLYSLSIATVSVITSFHLSSLPAHQACLYSKFSCLDSLTLKYQCLRSRRTHQSAPRVAGLPSFSNLPALHQLTSSLKTQRSSTVTGEPSVTQVAGGS